MTINEASQKAPATSELKQISTCFEHYRKSVVHTHRLRAIEDLQPYADARCSQKPIARKIHVQVACDQMRMFSGTKFVWHPSKYMQKDVTKRDWYRTKAFHLYEPFLSLLGCSACTMDGPSTQQNLRGCSLPSRVH
jgi:hypothetical protein